MPLGTQNFFLTYLIAAAGCVGYQFWGWRGMLVGFGSLWLPMWLLSSPWRGWHWRR